MGKATMSWIKMPQDWNEYRAVVNMVMTFWVPYSMNNVLCSQNYQRLKDSAQWR